MRRKYSVIAGVVVFVVLRAPFIGPLRAQSGAGNDFDVLTLSKVAITREDFTTAESLLKRRALNNQSSAVACFLLEVVYLRLSQTDKAKSQLVRAIDLRPDYPKDYNNLGILYDQQGQYDKSAPAFQQALKRALTFPESRGNTDDLPHNF